MGLDKVFDELLVLRCHAGDRKALELLVKRWNKKFTSFSFKLVKDLQAAQDITQESWISILKGLKRIKDPGKFSTWAYRIVYNKSMDWLRGNKRNATLGQEVPDAPVEETDRKTEQEKAVYRSLKELPEREKLILSLFYLEGHRVKEIAQILGIPAGTVKSRIYYAREHLKKIYKEVYHETK